MVKTVLALGLLATASGFVAPVAQTAPTTALAAMSKSVPFLTQPKKLDGSMVGDVGFDPLGLSESFDLKYMREAELKHGRVAMTAIMGFVAPELGVKGIFADGEAYSHTNPIKAAVSVPPSAWVTLILLAGIVETMSYGGKMTYMDMFEDGRVPGDFGYDPAALMTAEKKDKYELAELTHCRIAMIAIGGMIHMSFVTGQGLLGSTL